MMIGCKAKAFVAVLSTEVLVIGKTTFTELRMLRAMTYFWPQIFLWVFMVFAELCLKMYARYEQQKNFFTLENFA